MGYKKALGRRLVLIRSLNYTPLTAEASQATTAPFTPTNFFNGKIDDVRVYNYALTATQVRTLLNDNSAVRFGPPSGSP
jgi:hypothetical protein